LLISTGIMALPDPAQGKSYFKTVSILNQFSHE